MKTVIGDLLKLAQEGKFDVICHGCNCFCSNGAGIARQIRNNFPEADKADFQTKPGDISKLGTYTSSLIKRGGIEFTIVNLYTQYDYRGERKILCADYGAIREGFRKIKKDFSGLRIGFPAIGCGLANGDWSIVSKIIDEELEGEDFTFVEYAYNK